MNNCARCLLHCIYCQSLVVRSFQRTAVFVLWGSSREVGNAATRLVLGELLQVGLAVLNCGFRRTSGLSDDEAYQKQKNLHLKTRPKPPKQTGERNRGEQKHQDPSRIRIIQSSRRSRTRKEGRPFVKMQHYHGQSTTSADISRRSRKRARSSSPEQATDGRPRSVPKTTVNNTVQQALENLLDSGISPELLKAIKAEALSPISVREEYNTTSSNQSSLPQASNLHAHVADRSLNLKSARDVKQFPGLHHQHDPASLVAMQGSSVDSDKQNQLVGLFTQLIKAYALNADEV